MVLRRAVCALSSVGPHESHGRPKFSKIFARYFFGAVQSGDSTPQRGPHRVKVKNPKARAVKREAEEDWGR